MVEGFPARPLGGAPRGPDDDRAWFFRLHEMVVLKISYFYIIFVFFINLPSFLMFIPTGCSSSISFNPIAHRAWCSSFCWIRLVETEIFYIFYYPFLLYILPSFVYPSRLFIKMAHLSPSVQCQIVHRPRT
jgi:hypothetical protein